MPVWGNREITWRQILPPVVITVALVCLALVVRGCLGGHRADVNRKEQFNYYAAQLNNPDPVLVAVAARLLGELGDKRAIEPLRAKLSADDPRIVGAAAGALGRLGDQTVADRIFELLRHDNPYVVEGAAEGLGGLGDQRAVQPLVGLVRSPNVRVRRAVIEALGRLADASAMEPLAALESDPAAGLEPPPTDDQRAELAQALTQALERLRGGEGR